MTTANRDELAREVWLADPLRASAPDGAPSKQDYAIADRLIAKGHGQQQAITPQGTADIIAAHIPTIVSSSFNSPSPGNGRTCRCGARIEVLHSEMDDSDSDAQPYLDRKLAAHIAEILAQAGQASAEDAVADYDFGDPDPVKVPGAIYRALDAPAGQPDIR